MKGGPFIFDPSQVSDLVLDLDGDEGITLNGSDVSDWADQSVEGNDAAQGTASDQPLYNATDTAFKGHGSVEFDGTDHHMIITQDNSLDLTANGFEIFAVQWQRSLADEERRLLDCWGSNGNWRLSPNRTNDGRPHFMLRNNAQTDDQEIQSLVRVDDDLTHVINASYDGGDIVRIKVDRNVGESVFTFNGGFSVNNNQVNLGGSPTKTTMFNGKVGRILIWNRELTGVERGNVLEFLMNQYVPTVQPPVGGDFWDFTTGTFSRTTEASYQDSATSIVFAAIDERREEDRGSGVSGTLLEGPGTNIFGRSVAFARATWYKWNVTTNSGFSSPEGLTNSQRINFNDATDAYIRQQKTYTFFTDNKPIVFSVWLRTESGTHDVQLYVIGKDGAESTADFTVTTTWTRYSVSRSSVGTGTIFVEGGFRNNEGVTGAVLAYGGMCEPDQIFPSSFIKSTVGSKTRTADFFFFDDADVPQEAKEGNWKVAIRPLFANDEENSEGNLEGTLFAFDGRDEADSIKLHHGSGTGNKVDVTLASSSEARTTEMTWDRLDELTVTITNDAGEVSVAGADSGGADDGSGGSAWEWTAGQVQIGGANVGTANPFYGLINEPEDVIS